MKKTLTKIPFEISTSGLYYYNTGIKIEGKNPKMVNINTDLYLYGNCTGLSDDCAGLYGNCTGISGVGTGIFGHCTGIEGNLDECEISSEDRKRGIDITDLIID